MRAAKAPQQPPGKGRSKSAPALREEGMQVVQAVVARFPEQELAIQRLIRQNNEFSVICEDYEASLTAQRNWRAAGEMGRADEYVALSEEIAAEIEKFLNRAKPDFLQTPPDAKDKTDKEP